MSDPPEILYHYTSIDTFKAIMDNEHLRMTKYDQLNDETEVLLALNMITDRVKQFKCNKKQEELQEILLELLSLCKERKLFITSFSQYADDLEQWRAYASNGGVAIGFCSKELAKGYYYDKIPCGEIIRDGVIACDSDVIYKGENLKSYYSFRPPYGVWECNYIQRKNEFFSSKLEQYKFIVKEDFIDKIVQDLFSKNNIDMLDCIKRHMESNFAQQACLNSLNISLLKSVSTIKHSAYAGEKEWRWVHYVADEQNHPLNEDEKNRIYIKARIRPESFIKEVWISPHGDVEGIKRAVECYKENYGLGFKIHESKIPYRL